MDASTVAEVIPFTAWQQAVFVGLFIVLVVALLAWFSKENAKTQNFQQKQNESWQRFMREQNDRWQRWLDKSSADTVDAMTKVTEALERLSTQLDEHDKRVDSRIDAAAAGRRMTKPRGGQ